MLPFPHTHLCCFCPFTFFLETGADRQDLFPLNNINNELPIMAGGRLEWRRRRRRASGSDLASKTLYMYIQALHLANNKQTMCVCCWAFGETSLLLSSSPLYLPPPLPPSHSPRLSLCLSHLSSSSPSLPPLCFLTCLLSPSTLTWGWWGNTMACMASAWPLTIFAVEQRELSCLSSCLLLNCSPPLKMHSFLLWSLLSWGKRSPSSLKKLPAINASHLEEKKISPNKQRRISSPGRKEEACPATLPPVT